MSCSTLTTQSVQLNVAVASLPEGFCPASMQELANAIGARLIVSPTTEFNTFAIGSTAPSSNVGPWYKDCLTWFSFDDATATYLPEGVFAPGGFKNQEYHTASGNFIVPDFIYKLKVKLWGAGGGGGQGTAGAGKGGGGAGGYGLKIFDVTPGQIIPYTIGTGGMGGTPGLAGGASTFLTMTAGGGAGNSAANIFGVVGGTTTGGDMNVTGGSSGPADNGTGTGGEGGSSPSGGSGGMEIIPANAAIQNGILPGGGGAGSGGTTPPGNGAGGAVLIEY